MEVGTIREAPDGTKYVFLGGDHKSKDRWSALPSAGSPANANPAFAQSMQQELTSRNSLEKYNAGWGTLPAKAYLGLKDLLSGGLNPAEQQNYQGQRAIEKTLPGALGNASASMAALGPAYGKLFGSTAGITPTMRNLANVAGAGTIGAATGALTRPGERMRGAAEEGTGAALGTALGTLAQGIYKPALGSEAALMQERGIPITPGMAGGLFAKKTEDARAAINPSVSARQNEAIDKWNEVIRNDMLDTAGLPPVKGAGHEALQKTQKAFGDAYDAAGNKPIKIDSKYSANVQNLVDSASPNMKVDLRKSLREQVASAEATLRTPGQSNATAIRQIENDLGKLARTANDAGHSKLGDAYKALSSELENLRSRQGATTPRLDLGYAQFSRMKEAAAMKGPMDTGIVSPDQMKSAIRAASDKGERAFGEALMQKQMANASSVLGPTIPTVGPGTGEKIARNFGMPGAGAGVLGYGAATGNWWPAGILASLYGANRLSYWKPGMKALTGAYPPQQMMTPELMGLLAAGGQTQGVPAAMETAKATPSMIGALLKMIMKEKK